jgi:hypothetical protein
MLVAACLAATLFGCKHAEPSASSVSKVSVALGPTEGWTRAVIGVDERSDYAMAALGDKVVLFGGGHREANYTITNLNDTWEWDGANWTQKTSSNSPTERYDHKMATLGDNVVLFSGSFDSGFVNSETWTYSRVGRSLGTPCKSTAECVNGFCVDGVCCDNACGNSDNNDCQACSEAAGAKTDGTCALLPSTTVCRPADGACDVAENCTGASKLCPEDDKAVDNPECRDDVSDLGDSGRSDSAVGPSGRDADVGRAASGDDGCGCRIIGVSGFSGTHQYQWIGALFILALLRLRNGNRP